MSFDEIGQQIATRQAPQQDPGQVMVPHRQSPMERFQDARDMDPWSGRQAGGLSEKVVMRIFDTGIKSPEDFQSLSAMKTCLIDAFGRIPAGSTEKVRSLLRDFNDIEDLGDCQGCEKLALSLAVELLAEARLLCSDTQSESRGLTAVSSVISNINRTEQTVRMPVEEQPKKKIFGLFG